MEEIARLREKRWSLNGTTALVTGGTKGIGHAIVEELSCLGATVYTCSRNETELNKCLQEWEKSKLSVIGSVCDVSSRAEREKLMEKVSSAFNGKLNILVNNVGTGVLKPTVECTADDFNLTMATNFESAFHLCQLAHPLMKSSSTGALNQLTRNLACEWAKDNIRTNCVAPGYIRTPLVQFVLDDEEAAAKNEHSHSSRTIRRARGSGISGGIPMYACCFVHYWSNHLSRWRPNREWLTERNLFLL